MAMARTLMNRAAVATTPKVGPLPVGRSCHRLSPYPNTKPATPVRVVARAAKTSHCCVPRSGTVQEMAAPAAAPSRVKIVNRAVRIGPPNQQDVCLPIDRRLYDTDTGGRADGPRSRLVGGDPPRPIRVAGRDPDE